MPNHHYVPQFYLRRFGSGKHIPIILLDDDFRFIERAKILGQSRRPDYYRFPEVESNFAIIEGIASRVMQKVSERIQLTADDADFLKMYVSLQMIRTPAFVQTIENVARATISSAYAVHSGKERSEERISSIAIPHADILAWRQIGAASEAVRDLEMRYLISKRGGFLTSDQPVAVCNSWALKGGFARNGLACRGVMLFLPISARLTVMLYDSEVYSIRSQDRRSAYITIARSDEERLNKLQMVGNRSVLYLPNPDRHQDVQALARKVREANPAVTGTPVVKWAKSDSGLSNVIEVHERPVDFGHWTFLYESKDWREVSPGTRGFGVYGSRDSTPDAGTRMLSNARPWNSDRYTDDEGHVSFLRKRL